MSGARGVNEPPSSDLQRPRVRHACKCAARSKQRTGRRIPPQFVTTMPEPHLLQITPVPRINIAPANSETERAAIIETGLTERPRLHTVCADRAPRARQRNSRAGGQVQFTSAKREACPNPGTRAAIRMRCSTLIRNLASNGALAPAYAEANNARSHFRADPNSSRGRILQWHGASLVA
jgi:hypothetical protein